MNLRWDNDPIYASNTTTEWWMGESLYVEHPFSFFFNKVQE